MQIRSGPLKASAELKARAVDVYCDMTTEGGGWTLVWVGTGKEYSDPKASGSQWNVALLDSYDAHLSREDIASRTTVGLKTKLLEHWPQYTQICYERWLPSSLTGRSYASPGWAKHGPTTVATTPTNMNFWSVVRTDIQGWNFSLGIACRWCGGTTCEPAEYGVCHQMPTGQKKRHLWGCRGCASNYLWFQDSQNAWGSWNGFFPDYTYGFWRIRTGEHYPHRWSQYDALGEGDPMPGYGLYVR